MQIEIDGYLYLIKKAKFDLSKFDMDGNCDDYHDISYVVIEDTETKPRVRIFDGIFDDNNGRNSFDPLNYSEYIHARLEHGDEAYIDELYEIISTTNKTGEIYYNYLDDERWNQEFPNGIFIHKDLIIKAAL